MAPKVCLSHSFSQSTYSRLVGLLSIVTSFGGSNYFMYQNPWLKKEIPKSGSQQCVNQPSICFESRHVLVRTKGTWKGVNSKRTLLAFLDQRRKPPCADGFHFLASFDHSSKSQSFFESSLVGGRRLKTTKPLGLPWKCIHKRGSVCKEIHFVLVVV